MRRDLAKSSPNQVPVAMPARPSAAMTELPGWFEGDQLAVLLSRVLDFYEYGANPRQTLRFANLLLEMRGVPENLWFAEVDIVSFLDANYSQDASEYVSYGKKIKGHNDSRSVLETGELILAALKDGEIPGKALVKEFDRALSRLRKRG